MYKFGLTKSFNQPKLGGRGFNIFIICPGAYLCALVHSFAYLVPNAQMIWMDQQQWFLAFSRS